MKLIGARVALGPARSRTADLLIAGGRISFARARNTSKIQLDLSGYLILPGLINAHDHLEFSLFPRLGKGPYPNAKAWAEDIYRPDTAPIRDHLRVPKPARLLWGGLKNLLSGATTVSHHNPYEAAVFDRGFPVRVVKRYGWAHSLDFSPDITERYRQTPRRWPFLIHAAEGTDAQAAQEISRLNGVVGSRTVLVHAVGLDRQGMEFMKERGASIVWCPSSNRFTLGRTIHRDVLRSGIPVALGTDSCLTGKGDLIDEMAIARSAGRVSAEGIYAMVTDQAARILKLYEGQGGIRERGVADLVVVDDRGQTPAESLHGLRPRMVLVGGKVKLATSSLAPRLPAKLRNSLHPVRLGGRGRFLVAADTPTLFASTAAVLGDEIRLAGRRVRL